jgi:transcriptional regulator with XRE-family HTH domain
LPPEVKETLKDNLLKAMEKLDVFRELAFPNNFLSKRSKDDQGIERELEQRDNMDKPITEIKEEPKKSQSRTPLKTQNKKARFITIAGKKYQFDWEWQQLEDNVPKLSFLDKENGLIRIILNSKYRLLNVIRPDTFYIGIYVMEGIVEVFLKENNQPLDKVIAIRDEYAVKLADVISEEEAEEATLNDNNILNAQSYLLKQKSVDEEKLTDNEKKALQLRLEKGLTLQKIADQMGVTRQRVDQLFQAGVKKINDVQISDDRVEKIKVTHKILSSEEDQVIAIITNVSENYGISIDELLGSRRKKELVLPRHIVMYLLRKRLKLSFPKIAEIMKKNDHTTIMHACSKIEKLIKDQKIAIK